MKLSKFLKSTYRIEADSVVDQIFPKKAKKRLKQFIQTIEIGILKGELKNQNEHASSRMYSAFRGLDEFLSYEYPDLDNSHLKQVDRLRLYTYALVIWSGMAGIAKMARTEDVPPKHRQIGFGRTQIENEN